MKQVSEGIAEAISATLNQYDLTDEEYQDLFEGAADAFADYIEANKPPTVIFRIETRLFLDCDTFQATSRLTDQAQEELLHAAEAAADDWIEANA